ncbi:pentatricopeptide repeat-containing protein At4g01570 [Rhodamnia argentea]|uniref:Pentatricopeptide repeat-containing protein At4g01570 n=1 Tax=Rhodamnia argentea TaxID=178133 RepID=A0A8B8NZL8_9MYRT|nr:pentatricopeptide repeat-containing protein At4g01570 [Rhodamnia argentea]
MHHRHALKASKKPSSSRPHQLANTLLVASVAKTLSQSGTRNLGPDTVPVTDSLLRQILSHRSLHPSRKLEFFTWSRSLAHFGKHSASMYSHLFWVMCRAHQLEEVPLLLRLMKEDGVVADSWTFKLLLDAFIRSGKFDAALEILDHMEELGMRLNSHMYTSVLAALVRKGQVGLALSIFYKLLDSSNGEVSLPSAVAYNEVLVALRKADMRAEFRELFDKLRGKDGFELDAWGYNICIHAFGCWGDLPSCLRLFEEMKAKSLGSFGPDLCTYNSLIQSLCLAGKVRDALIVWGEMKGSGHDPDAFTYRILIQGCSKSYLIDDAARIFDEMQYNGFRPDVIAYNSLLDGLLKAKRVNEACQLFDKMVQEGIRATCWTYNILIDGLFKNGRAEGAYTIFCDLKKKGQFVDGITYSIVTVQLCKEGQLEEALKLVQEMEVRGFVVDLVTITSLLIGFHKHGWWDGMEMLMKHIRDGNLVPSVLKWQADMETAMERYKSKRKDYTPMFPSKGGFHEIMSLVGSPTVSEEPVTGDDEALCIDSDQWSSSPYMDRLASQVNAGDYTPQLFSLSKGPRVQGQGTSTLDTDMVNTFLSIFLAKGKLSLACKLFEMFTDMGIDPTSYTYNSLMSSFVKKGYFDEALGVLNEMGERVCPTDIVTYNLIIQGLGKMGKADLASAVLDKLMKHGGYLDVVMYNTLINALGKAGRIDEACKLFEQMRTSGICPDVVTFNTLIEVHSKAGRLKDAYKFLKMMLDAGVSPNHVTDTTLDFLGREIEKLRYQKASMVRVDTDDSVSG